MSSDSILSPKERAAKAALEIVIKLAPKASDIIGLGTGSTADPFTKFLAKAFKRSKIPSRPVCVTSIPTADLCQELELSVLPAIPTCGLRVVVDGADEVNLKSGAVIKGGGAAALAEKDAARAALRNGGEFIVIVDESKLSDQLGKVFVYGVPVHVRPEARLIVSAMIQKKFNATTSIRGAAVAKDLTRPASVTAGKAGCYGALFSREGEFIIDVRFKDEIPQDFNREVLTLPGVTGCGLFALEDSPTRIIVAYTDTVKEFITPHGQKQGLTPILS